MFKTIFVEESIQHHPRSLEIISKAKSKNIEVVNSYTEIFGKVKKPYLQKRDNLNLFIARKKRRPCKRGSTGLRNKRREALLLYPLL